MKIMKKIMIILVIAIIFAFALAGGVQAATSINATGKVTVRK